jgi:hypothetical protein
MAERNRYSPEVRDRAVGMVTGQRGEYDTEWETMFLGATTLATLRKTRLLQFVAPLRADYTPGMIEPFKTVPGVKPVHTRTIWRVLSITRSVVQITQT